MSSETKIVHESTRHKRKNFKESDIRSYWANTNVWHEKFDSVEEFLEEGTCFACGFDYEYIEKAHIHALGFGGKDELDNIHMLCKCCHEASELLRGVLYWKWFYNRSISDVFNTMLAKYNCLPKNLINILENADMDPEKTGYMKEVFNLIRKEIDIK